MNGKDQQTYLSAGRGNRRHPADETTTTIVDGGTFKTRTEAETGMKTMKVCTTN